jgi:serine/threonine protein kinase
MGHVYLAERHDGGQHAKVALKVLRRIAASPDVVARFEEERRNHAALQHPGLTRLLDSGTTERGMPYLVMEHVEGAPLLVHAAALSLRERVQLMRRVCEPLAYAHARHAVHCEIEPANALITPDGQPKLLDFAPKVSGETKPEYASPEQVRGEAASVASDVYALGAVLYHVLTGQPPVPPDADMETTLHHICEIDPPLPSSVAARGDRGAGAADLDSIVMRALQKDPAARYPSIAALSEDLGRFLEGRPVEARDAKLAHRLGKFAGRHKRALALGLAGCAVTALLVWISATR